MTKVADIKMYKLMKAPRLLSGNETLVPHTEKYLNKIQPTEMKFLRSVKFCSVLYKINNERIIN